MPTSPHGFSALLTRPPLDRDVAREVAREVARAVAMSAGLVAVAGDALLHEGTQGFGLVLFIAIVGAEVVALSLRAGKRPSMSTIAWLCCALAFALMRAWREAEELQAFDLLAMLFALGMAALASNGAGSALMRGRPVALVRAALMLAADVARGLVPAAREAVGAEERSASARHVARVVRTACVGGAVALLFGALLRGADPVFASFVQVPGFDAQVIVSHVIVFNIIAWVMAGWVRGALLDTAIDAGELELTRAIVGSADATTMLTVLNVLFAAFMAVQVRSLVGGDAFLRERTGLTVASYARQGFFEMVAVVTLVVPVLLATRPVRAAGEATRAAARRHTMLAIPLIGLLAAMIVSALFKLHLYMTYFGLTTDRFYPMVFMLWLGAVLLWFAATVLRDRPRRFLAGGVLSALVVLAGLNVVAPDRVVAVANAARAHDPLSTIRPTLDLDHLSLLSGEAVDVAVTETLAAAPAGLDAPLCTASRRLLKRWGSSSPARQQAATSASWRLWNVGERHALQVVAAHEAALLRVKFARCAVAVETPPTGAR